MSSEKVAMLLSLETAKSAATFGQHLGRVLYSPNVYQTAQLAQEGDRLHQGTKARLYEVGGGLTGAAGGGALAHTLSGGDLELTTLGAAAGGLLGSSLGGYVGRKRIEGQVTGANKLTDAEREQVEQELKHKGVSAISPGGSTGASALLRAGAAVPVAGLATIPLNYLANSSDSRTREYGDAKRQAVQSALARRANGPQPSLKAEHKAKQQD